MEGLVYDRNGNIEALKRRTETGAMGDELTYSYQSGTNRLSQVQDAYSGAGGARYDALLMSYYANGALRNETHWDANGEWERRHTYDERGLAVQVDDVLYYDAVTHTYKYRYTLDGQRYWSEGAGQASTSAFNFF